MTYTLSYIFRSKYGCLLGDTIHTVKPYFGLGLNSALEDVMSLEKALQKHKDDLRFALPEYSRDRAKQAKAMVQMSKTLDGGIFNFIIPLVVDSILHKKLPFIFAPNTITLLQNEKLSFTQVLWRKRLDRVVQFGLFSLIALVIRQSVLMLLFCLKMLLRTKIKIVV
jgi:kynurenine 3-monooxygenase